MVWFMVTNVFSFTIVCEKFEGFEMIKYLNYLSILPKLSPTYFKKIHALWY